MKGKYDPSNVNEPLVQGVMQRLHTPSLVLESVPLNLKSGTAAVSLLYLMMHLNYKMFSVNSEQKIY